MLQLSELYKKCHELFYQQYNKELTSANLQTHIANLIELIKGERKKCTQSGPFLQTLQYKVDQYLWTDKVEYIDRSDFSPIDKLKIVNGLHKKNVAFGTYKKFFAIILPYIRAINLQEHRACKILEIAGGSGQLAYFIATQSKVQSLNVDITCSDIVEHYVIESQKKAQGNNLVKFKKIDALSLDTSSKGEYDLIINLHSLHHFSAGQLAKIFYGSQAIVNKAFIAIDAFRGIRNLLFIGGSALIPSIMNLNSMYVHDAWISARKMYPQKLLEVIAKIACPKSRINVAHPSIGLTALIIEPRM